jgi:cellulose synthase (UDP-forming)
MSAETLNCLSEHARIRRVPARKLRIRRETVYTWMGLIFTVATSIMVERDIDPLVRAWIASGNWTQLADDVALILIVYYLIFGTILYFLCRLGYLKRLAAHQPATREELEAIYDQKRVPLLTILVPSYREDERVVRQTLMSAALTEYPDRDIVLLIDDPPDSQDPDAATALDLMRRLPADMETIFRSQQRRYSAELASFERRRSCGAVDFVCERQRLARLYRKVAAWMEDEAAAYEVRNHTDRLFVQRILLEPARAHRVRATELEEQAPRPAEPDACLLREYRRLAALFGARFSGFERKRFANLSHAPNKAMNLNSYLGLMGGSFREASRSDGLHIEECEPEIAQWKVPRPDYVITLDADSLLLFDYAMRLVHTMEQPAGKRLAVVQTPYTAVPGSSSILERTAGAQTDLQWLMGQGATMFGATFWVGASALLRRASLEDICEVEYEAGHPIKKYVRDRTLVEDTESSVDLIAAGWKLYNYPDRLCYSATPPDFGSLVIQRRRWANGGLLVLPKLFRYLLKTPWRIKRIPEAILSVQYLVCTAAVNLAMLSLIMIKLDNKLPYFWLVLTPIGYYMIYGRDLVFNGYEWWDLPRVYALNLLLIPINLGGVAKSVHQWWTTRQTPFVRTPKVSGRTAAPAMYILATWGIIWCVYIKGLVELRGHRYINSSFALLNAAILVYALGRFAGILRSIEDLVANIRFRLKPAPPKVSPTARKGGPNQRLRQEPVQVSAEA